MKRQGAPLWKNSTLRNRDESDFQKKLFVAPCPAACVSASPSERPPSLAGYALSERNGRPKTGLGYHRRRHIYICIYIRTQQYAYRQGFVLFQLPAVDLKNSGRSRSLSRLHLFLFLFFFCFFFSLTELRVAGLECNKLPYRIGRSEGGGEKANIATAITACVAGVASVVKCCCSCPHPYKRERELEKLFFHGHQDGRVALFSLSLSLFLLFF